VADDITTPTRRLVDEVYNKGRVDVLGEILGPGYVGNDPALPEPIQGAGGERELVTAYRNAFPDLEVTVDDMIAAGDKVVTRWTARGTHRGALFGIEPTGKEVTITGIGIARVEDGRIAEAWSNWDTLGFLQQLGVIATAGRT
jgi:steroid delta-isomerase-like uncharacterized protein